jgi:glycerophosphoryl diester phosphodiesterase
VSTLFAMHPGQPPLVFGHRGYSSRAPENTIAAFRLLLEHRIAGVELDVHQTADGRIVVSHDESLLRAAGVDCRIATSTLAELCEYDVGAWFGDQFRGERIPLLSEVIELLGTQVVYDIEIKPYNAHLLPSGAQSTESLVIDLLRRSGIVDRSVVSSFDPRVIRRCRGIDRAIESAVIYADVPEMPWFLRQGQGRLLCGATVMKPEWHQVTKAMVARHHRAGRAVVPWKVDSADDAANLTALGVDGLISNCPGELDVAP